MNEDQLAEKNRKTILQRAKEKRDMKTKIDCGCEKDVFVCRTHCKAQDTAQHTPTPLFVDDLTHAIAMLAQAVINIDEGLNIIAKDSRIYNGMKTVVNMSPAILRAVNAYEKDQSEIAVLKFSLARCMAGNLDQQERSEIKRMLAKAECRP